MVLQFIQGKLVASAVELLPIEDPVEINIIAERVAAYESVVDFIVNLKPIKE